MTATPKKQSQPIRLRGTSSLPSKTYSISEMALLAKRSREMLKIEQESAPGVTEVVVEYPADLPGKVPSRFRKVICVDDKPLPGMWFHPYGELVRGQVYEVTGEVQFPHGVGYYLVGLQVFSADGVEWTYASRRFRLVDE